MTESTRPRIIGLNHIALEVGDIEEALAFLRTAFQIRASRQEWRDQFIALQKQRSQSADAGRHFGLVVDDKEAARRAFHAARVASIDGHCLDFRYSWGNRIEIVGYDNIQFTIAEYGANPSN